jgi:hypothetical protein
MKYFLDFIPADSILKYHVIYFIHAPMLVGAFIAFVGAKKVLLQGAIGKSLTCIGIALFLNALGFFMWFVSETLLGRSDLDPAPADFFFLFFYVFLGIGMFFLLKVYQTYITRIKLIKALTLVLLSGMFMFYLFELSLPSFEEGVFSLEALFDTFYTFTDVFLVGVVIMTLQLAGGRIFKGLYVLLFGLILNVVADLLFFARIKNDTYYTGDIGDLFYAVSGLVLAIGVYFIAHNFSASNLENNNIQNV